MNTVYTARALEEMRAEGKKISAADIARLLPLGFEHFNMLVRQPPQPQRGREIDDLPAKTINIGTQ
ncbi:Tn3 family transposase [Nonomuraea sp. H19]|uniref:Tn3 family transposase n=1 Tax=Nonomuraea sp. H19 TaxID=3452206 RepID=UPI003F8A23CC